MLWKRENNLNAHTLFAVLQQQYIQWDEVEYVEYCLLHFRLLYHRVCLLDEWQYDRRKEHRQQDNMLYC